jgi:ABC-type phosphate transport system substrate-binding protein
MATKAKAVFLTAVSTIAVGASCAVASGTALADPPAGTYRPYAGVGSDTVQAVFNALDGDVAGTTGVFFNVASYDATGSATIQTKANGPAFVRPNGSGDGAKALSDAVSGTPYNGVNVTGQIAFSRSSSGPSTVTPGGALTYVPFARDAVAYAYVDSTGSLSALTTAQLNQIYSSNSPVVINGVTVTPYLPQSASGTRKFFLKAIGVTTIGSAVVQSSGEENNGSVIAGTQGAIIPFSAAQWTSQVDGVVTNTTAGVQLGSPNGVAPVSDAGGGRVSPNATFYNDATFGRDVYVVLPTDSITGDNADINLVSAFVQTPGNRIKINTAQAKSDIRRFGFLTVSYVGDLTSSHTLQGPLTPG